MHEFCFSIYDSKIFYSTITHIRIEQNMMLSTFLTSISLENPDGIFLPMVLSLFSPFKKNYIKNKFAINKLMF